MEGQQIWVTCFVERGEIIGLSADMAIPKRKQAQNINARRWQITVEHKPTL
jgi:hypothetical protein